MKVLVTGGAGFVGGHVVRALRGAGAEVVVGTRATCDVTGELPDLTGLDAIVHAASAGAVASQGQLVDTLRVNVEGTARLYVAARQAGVPRFVHLGSAYELGPSAEALSEDAPLQPLGVYGAAKAAGWLVLEQLAAAHGGGLTGLRLYTQYGLGDDPRRLIPGVVDAVKRGVPIDLSAGTQRRDFVWVSDVARLIAGLLDHGAPEGLFHVCTGRPLSVRDAATRVARCGGGEHLLRFGAAAAHEGAARDVIGDPGRLERWCRAQGLGHLVAWTSLEEGARQLFTP